MDELVFFLEEESAQVMLQSVVAKLQLEQQDIATRYIVFEGKQHLDQNLERKLRGYVNPKPASLSSGIKTVLTAKRSSPNSPPSARKPAKQPSSASPATNSKPSTSRI